MGKYLNTSSLEKYFEVFFFLFKVTVRTQMREWKVEGQRKRVEAGEGQSERKRERI